MREAPTLSANADSTTDMMISPIDSFCTFMHFLSPFCTFFDFCTIFGTTKIYKCNNHLSYVMNIVVTFKPIMQLCNYAIMQLRILKALPNHIIL